MDVANTLKVLGVSKVYVIYRRSLKEMPADNDDLEMARANYVSIRPQSVVTEIVGQNGGLVGLRGIETDWKDPELRTADNLVKVPGTEFSLKVDIFVWAIGNRPEEAVGVLRELRVDDGDLLNPANWPEATTTDER